MHISQLSDTFVKDPRSIVSPGDKVQVRVLEVSLEKKQIALTMKKEGEIHAKKSDSDSRANQGRSNTSRPSAGERGGRPSVDRGSQGNRYESPTVGNNPFANLGTLLSSKKG